MVEIMRIVRVKSNRIRSELWIVWLLKLLRVGTSRGVLKRHRKWMVRKVWGETRLHNLMKRTEQSLKDRSFNSVKWYKDVK